MAWPEPVKSHDSGAVREHRTRLRQRIAAGDRLLGTFIKLATTDVLDMCAPILDLVVIDMEHSTLSETEVVALLRHARGIGLPALVRVPAVDPGRINRLLEAGATGIQLSMLSTQAEREALQDVSQYPPIGHRSVSLAHPTAAFGGLALADYLSSERDARPFLVGQIESEVEGDLAELIAGLDVAFVGTTDLAVSRGLSGVDGSLADAVAEISRGASEAGVAFGGWASQLEAVAAAGLDGAAMVLLGSDLQILATGIRELAEHHDTRK